MFPILPNSRFIVAIAVAIEVNGVECTANRPAAAEVFHLPGKAARLGRTFRHMEVCRCHETSVQVAASCSGTCADAYAWASSAFGTNPWEPGEIPT
jgi:hypothetical protein